MKKLCLCMAFLLSGCAGAISLTNSQYERFAFEAAAGRPFSQEINGLEVSATRRFDLSFGCYGNNALPVYITILNKSKNSYKFTNISSGEYLVPSIYLVKRYIDSPQDTTDSEDFYTLESHYVCDGLLKSINMTEAYGVKIDKLGIVRGACAEEFSFKNIISPGSTSQGFAFFLALPFEEMNQDISALRLEIELQNIDTGKKTVFLIPLGSGFNFKERFKEIKGSASGRFYSYPLPEFRKPAWIEEEINLDSGKLWQKVKKSLFEMKEVNYLSEDADNHEFGFNLSLSKPELLSTVSVDLSKIHRETLNNAVAFIRIRFKDSGALRAKLSISSYIIMGWAHINSNGKIENNFLKKLKASLGLQKYEWLEE